MNRFKFFLGIYLSSIILTVLIVLWWIIINNDFSDKKSVNLTLFEIFSMILGLHLPAALFIGVTVESIETSAKKTQNIFFGYFDDRPWLLLGVGMIIPLLFIITCGSTFIISFYALKLIRVPEGFAFDDVAVFIKLLVFFVIECVVAHMTVPIFFKLFVKTVVCTYEK